MRTIVRSLATIAVLVPLVLVGCEGAEEPEEEPGIADTVTADTGRVGATSTGIDAGGTTSEVTVTNPMPHAMIVSVEFDGGGSHELGTVPANGTQSFSLAASPGETVRLVATDEDGTHSPSTRLTLEETNTWTVGG